ncbi:Rv3235 family protein [Streptomyces sp. URMC 123]|uniref:Rv3235 family protein n=1 Tax=Streptomyces sp. URMC 123 TaxID=3423403 RepID=UPI003F1935ED
MSTGRDTGTTTGTGRGVDGGVGGRPAEGTAGGAGGDGRAAATAIGAARPSAVIEAGRASAVIEAAQASTGPARRRTGPPRRGDARGRDPRGPRGTGGPYGSRGPRDGRGPGAPTAAPAAATPNPAALHVAALAAAARHRARLPRYWFAERLLVVLSGRRPVHWMLGHTIGPAYDQLARLAPGAPLRLAGRGHPVVRHCDEYRPRAGVIEAFARIEAGERLRAMAFRLERGADERWRCSAVELGV